MRTDITRHILTLTLLLFVRSASANFSTFTYDLSLPKAQATHFCQLFLYDGETIMPMSAHARKLMKATDSLTAEQLFTSFVFYQDNWQSLRIFPHVAADGTVAWYSPADLLVDAPSNTSLFTHHSSLSSEHQKYIREVLPRLRQEIIAGNWQTVDAYIDRMIQYQCRFGSEYHSEPVPGQSKTPLFFIILAIFLAVSLFLHLRRNNPQSV